MSTPASPSPRDRPIKRRWEILVGRYTLNPLVRVLFRVGITLPGMALLETTGRRTGLPRRIPVLYARQGQTVWLIAQHGEHSGWVRNLQARPEVRVRLGRRWSTGAAELLPGDDVRARSDAFASSRAGRAVTRAMLRALESSPATVRIDLR